MMHFGKRPNRPFEQKPRAEVDDELAFHLQSRIDDYIARGMHPDAARAAALQRLGDLANVRDECTTLLEADRRASSRRDWWDDLRQDVRYGIRSAVRAPLFSLLAIATLALGIGANAAVFGVVKSVLLDALPYADADRLVRIYSRLQDGALERSSISAGAVSDIIARQRSFTRLAPFFHSTIDITYARDGNPRILAGALASSGFFPTLGVSMALGRAFTLAEEQTGAPNVVILTYAAWQRELGGDVTAVGRTLQLNGEAFEIVGVLPRDFVAPVGMPDLWLPLNVGPALRSPIRARKQHWLGLVGRLAPNVTNDAAQRELTAIAAELAREHPDSDVGITFASYPLRADMVGDARMPLLILMASAALVLAITCANLAGALLSRSLSRRKEFAVRMALGAGRSRLVRQLLTESVVLSVVGGIVGLVLASASLAALRSLALSALPAYAHLGLDPLAIVAAGALALLTGVAFGVAPAVAIGRGDTQATLREESRGASETGRTRRVRGMLVAGQIALCLSLLAGAGLLVRSLWAMATAPLGFDPASMLAFSIRLPSRSYGSDTARVQFTSTFEQRLRTIPSVAAVASASELPSPNMNRNGLAIEGVTWPSDAGAPFIAYSAVSDDYFRTMRIALRRGRTFDATDRPDGTPSLVISEGMARRFWPNGNAIGARVRLGPNANAPWWQVIGIVADVRNDPARPVPEPMTYGSIRQDSWNTVSFVVRVQGDPLSIVKAVERELATLDRSFPIDDVATMRALLDERLSSRRLPAVLMIAFGVLALVLASVGVYAMFASMAAAREREFGVRVALGSSRGAIAGLVLRQGGTWLVVGVAGGAVGVVLVGRFVARLLYGIEPLDPLALGVAMGTLLLCAAVALLVPVRRATRVDPIQVLR